MARGTVRLVVASPDGRRVLARPNGLAGWALPSIAVDLPFDAWTDAASAAATRAIGAPVEPVGALGPRSWAVRAIGRVPASGAEWIDEVGVDRLGADAGTARLWFSQAARNDGGN